MTEIKKKILNMQVETNSLKTAVKLYKKEIIRLRKVVDRQNRLLKRIRE